MTLTLDDAQIGALAEQARRELAQRSLIEFCIRMDQSYQSARHTQILCEHLEALERRDIDRLMVFMPPRHSKSYHVSQRFPAWYLGKHPQHQAILASYGASLAESNSRIVRNLLMDDMYPFNTRVAPDSSAVDRWATAQGGVVVAAGVGGGITGRGAHIFLMDDLIKDREEADSETMRQKAWDFYLEVALTRLMPGGSIGLCATRWHADDVPGRILNGPDAAQWTVVDMPALSDHGEALWPEWFDSAYLTKLKTVLGSRGWNALYQQRPTAAEGGMFKRAWFTRRWSERPQLKSIVQSVDSAFKTGVANDYSVVATWATDGIDYYLLNIVRARVEFPELCQMIAGQYQEYKPHAVLVEDTAAGQAAIQTLKRTSPMPIVPVKVTASKESRAAAVSPICEAGKVVLPLGAAWVDEWIDEHAAFPTGQHDDMVDTTSMALARLAQWQTNLSDQTRNFRMVPAPKKEYSLMDELRRLRN